MPKLAGVNHLDAVRALEKAVDEDTREMWADQIATRDPAKALRHHVHSAVEIGHYWFFRRSAGQPGHINIAYGLIAASLAELTAGFLYADDPAWDYGRFPCGPAAFYDVWMRPDKAIDDEHAWALRCIEGLREVWR